MSQNQSKSMFWVGVFLLIINIPVGLLGGAGVAAGLAYSSHFIIILSAVVYAASWLMFGLGIWLAGKEGVVYARELWRRIFRRQNPPQC